MSFTGHKTSENESIWEKPMNADPLHPPGTRLRGLDPDLLLGVLEDDVLESPPAIPGWRVTGVAGSGGSGIVWRALRDSDGIEAAIKIARPDDPDTIERIESEAATLRAFDHPHIVRLIDAGPVPSGDQAGGMFLAMEFIDGPALLHQIPEQGLPAGQALPWFSQIASAVGHAHDAGVLHRDLKPANVLLAPGGKVKVADFGLARPVHRRVHQLSLTRAGLVAGTAEYLPPEAYRRDYEPDVSADIFALGVLLHEMLTGAPPRGAWKPASSRRGVDVRIDAIIARAMDPEPARRWPHARDMDAALREVSASPPRYSGVPMVTFPVRVADALWTVLGLLVLTAAAASTLSLEKSQVMLPFDLVGGHGRLTGGFQAVFFLLLASLPLGVWQILRLRRFRRVPLREALPSPFGLNLGTSRLAVLLVALCQGALLWFPVFLILTMFLGTGLSWIRPGDPPWLHGLAVTRLDEDELLGPWTTVTSSKGFWLWETFGTPGHGLAQTVDRISFVPFYGPLLMCFSATTLACAFGLTVFTACRGWWCRSRRFCPAALAAAIAVGSTLVISATAREWRAAAGKRDSFDDWVVDAHMTSRVRDLAEFLLDPERQWPGNDWAAFYQDPVDYREHGWLPAARIPELVKESRRRRENTRARIIQFEQSWEPSDESFTVTARAIECFDHPSPGGECGGDDLTLELSGTIGMDGTIRIGRERLHRTPMYRCKAGRPSHAEAEEWVSRFLNAAAGVLADPEGADLAFASLFHAVPGGLPDDSFTGWVRRIPDHRGGLPALLGVELSRTGTVSHRIHGHRPGGRTRIEVPFHGRDGRPTRVLTVDLIRINDSWRCVKLAF